MALSLTSAALEDGSNVVSENAAAKLILTGTFDLATPYRVYVGTNGSTADAVCFAGQGKGPDAQSVEGLTLEVYLPSLTAGEVVSVYVQERDTPGNNAALADALRVVSRSYYTHYWSMKSLFPPRWRLGARSFQNLPQVESPKNLLLWSADFSSPVWNTEYTSLGLGEPDPFGGSLGALVTEDSDVSPVLHNFSQSAIQVEAGTVYTVSLYAKEVPPAVPAEKRYFALGLQSTGYIFDLGEGTELAGYALDGDGLGADIVPVDHLPDGEGWYRISVAARPNATELRGVSLSVLYAPSGPGFGYQGLDIPVVRVAFPSLDIWPVPRAYQLTEGEAVL